MDGAERQPSQDRVKAAIGAAAFHVLLGYVLLTGLGYRVTGAASENLKIFRVAEPPPPPPIEEPLPEERSAAKEGEASPANLKSKPSPVVAPPPKVPLKVPPPLPTSERAHKVPPGSDRTAGSSDLPGPGSGSGGQGTGTGSGGQGTGSGSGGIAARAQRVSGSLEKRDYPKAALRSGAQGSVAVRFTVGTDGRVSGCRVLRSSGHPELDSTTCRLIEKRFRYRSARNGEGQPVPEILSTTFDWGIIPPPVE